MEDGSAAVRRRDLPLWAVAAGLVAVACAMAALGGAVGLYVLAAHRAVLAGFGA